MTISVTLPEAGERKTTKDYVMSILGETYPLTIKKIHNLIKKRYGHYTTYQATYKTVKDMLKQKILKESDKKYFLNIEWVKDVHDLTEQIRSNYSTKEVLSTFSGVLDAKVSGDITVMKFKSIFDLEKYLYYFEKNFLFKKKNQIICKHYRHDWKLLFYLRAEYNRMNFLKENKSTLYALCKGDTFIDKWAAKFYNKLGMKIKTGINIAETSEVEVYGDNVIQIFTPQELSDSLNAIFSTAKRIDDLDAITIIREILEKETEIQLLINKDAKIAEEIRTQTIKHFKV